MRRGNMELLAVPYIYFILAYNIAISFNKNKKIKYLLYKIKSEWLLTFFASIFKSFVGAQYEKVSIICFSLTL